jgi:KaiC/GvpD/RAD55 family RecA-like ATPase
MTRVKTGIKGFDELVEGGFVEGSTVLLSGDTGSGKTIFGLQFLYSGASKYDEPGVLVTLESRPDELRREALEFGWDLKELEDDGSLIILDAASSRAGQPTSEPHTLRRGFDMGEFHEKLYDAILSIQARRLVIDCISVLGMRFPNPADMRSELFKISALLRSDFKNDENETWQVTSLLISETTDSASQTRTGIEQHLTQGLITLNLNEANGALHRDLVVWKMRQSAHSMKKHAFSIGKSGIALKLKKSTRSKKS